ncbi:histone-lysine N-methyltransferase SUVR5 isoform X4 [Zea mays]|uniref:Histone-lysine N-methyltransferase SUVR5 n=1 Tax=Zea mays TaxID=4577 RepID=A0A1D6HHS7_MAIZE|nr:histone-lysine N-methyltransferase SUVR5 isoform X4 [Zea mays]AQK74071.1 Histone-lysine N-methyltransferase SUVR5 [Zea mays]AQK74089.1 Histone-lysine N-methyltransferase SUVR5 [Zea mays]|eukprot:XP_020394254.1 histone-lysine N-methyltransferase SUVR5 isoform X6 [Zea mays]
MLMDPPVMQMDCKLKNDVDKTSSIDYDRKVTISHDDYGWAGSDVKPKDDIVCNPVEGAELRNKNGDSSYSNVKLQLNSSAGNNNGLQTDDDNFTKQYFGKKDMHHRQEEMHPSSNTVSLPTSCRLNGDATPSEEEKIAEDRVKVDGNVDAVIKEVETDLVGCHAHQKEFQCTLQDLSEIACSIDLVHNTSSPQGENKKPVSPLNGMGHYVDNNSCNGDTNYKGEELNMGDAGDEDHAIALWVKWRGKWQTGIRCCRVDCPLPTLRAKPTHDRKSYVVVFFPRTKTYSWVDMLLVLPIEECPLPLVNGTHRKWRKLVKDLNIPRRFNMQNLAVFMINLIDELHIEAVVDDARKATTWKEFALEASCCRDYTDLGKMLLKFQNMILPDYISYEWLQNSFKMWNQKCMNAHDAETIEMLCEFRLLDVPQRSNGQSAHQTEGTNGLSLYDSHNIEDANGSQKFICRLCGLKFDLQPDLGRHHKVAHMDSDVVGHSSLGRGKYQLNRGRHYYSAFKKSLRPTSTLKKRSSSGIEKNFKFQSSALTSQIIQSETSSFGKLQDFQCSDVAQTLFSKIQKTRPHPSNLDILSVARTVCCKTSLAAALEVKYGSLPENIFVKAAKLCSDNGIQIDWHQEVFICPKGCKSRYNSNALLPMQLTAVDFPEAPSVDPLNDDEMWAMEEYHYVLDSKHFGWKPKNESVVLYEDISFGREKVPIVCVIDMDAKDSLGMKPEELLSHGSSVPWQGFHYITKRLMDSSLINSENSMPGCACSHPECSPEKCGHVSLFDGVYASLVDINGTPIHGRFAYDENSKIILQEGYPIYECNSSCTCDSSCRNKVLQKGLLVKLELFRTENKGWAIRAAEPIPQGTFVCEYIGEVVKADKTMKNAESVSSKSGCNYLFDIASQIDRERLRTVGAIEYLIDATRSGNVSRYINHSCSPNLSTRLVLVESKDCQLAHIGLFANQDIAVGEELAYDYRQKLVAGDGCFCHCGGTNCRGRVY